MRTSMLTTAARRRREGSAVVCILVGGSLQVVGNYPETAQADLVVLVDVEEELARFRERPKPGVVTFAVGRGLTMATLMEKCECRPEFREFAQTRSGVTERHGLAQLRYLGGMTGEVTVKDPEFQSFIVDELFQPLLKMHNGCIEHVHVIGGRGLSGGTGSTLWHAVANYLSEFLASYLNATVLIEEINVGSMTYSEGCGDRINPNASAALSGALDFVLSPNHPPNEGRACTLFDAHMVGRQKDLRDKAGVEVIQAYRSDDVQRPLQRMFPNEAASHELGAIRIVRVGLGERLPDEEIACEVADVFRSQLTAIQEIPGEEQIDRFEVDLQDQKPLASCPTLRELVDDVQRAKGVRPANFLARCQQLPVHVVAGKVIACIANQSPRDHLWFISSPCSTLQETARKLSRLKSLHAGLTAEIKVRMIALPKQAKAVNVARKRLEAIDRMLFPNSLWEHGKALFGNPQSNLLEFQNAVQGFRDQAIQAVQMETEQLALTVTLAEVGDELAAESRRLAQMIELMKAVGRPSWERPRVTVGDIDSIYPEFRSAVARDMREPTPELLRLLASCVHQVTLAGLAKVVQAKDDRLDAIVDAIEWGEFLKAGPAWGGQHYQGPKLEILTLPPMNKKLVEELRRHLSGRLPDVLIGSADCASGGVNVVLFEIFTPKRLQDIFTPLYRKYFNEARQAPHIYFTNGDNGSRWHEGLSKAGKEGH